MKKFIYSCLFLAMAAMTFSSCEDVPAPYNMPTENESQKVQPSGTGTAADPFNVAGVVKYIDDGGSAETEVYVKGKVVSVEQGSWNANYGSLKYYISEDGTPTNQFYVFNGYAGPNRTKFSGEDALKQGDEVVICGKVDVYNGTKEFLVNNYIVSLNGVGGTPDTPTTGKGSESNPYTVAEAIAAIKAGAPTNEVYLTGIISEVQFYNEKYKSLSYYISDDGKSKDMQVYSGKGLNGADFTSKGDLKVGQKVTIKGIIKSFTDKNGTEIMEVDKSSTIIKIEGEGTGGEVTPKPDTPDTGNGKITFAADHKTLTLENSNATAGESVSFDFTAQNYENQTDMTTIKLSDGTTITFDANGEKNGSKYYTLGTAVRVYKNNKIIVNGTKEIAKIIFHCNAPYTNNKGETVNCDGNETATINFSGKTATYTNVFTGTTGGGVQLRFSSIDIVYAK